MRFFILKNNWQNDSYNGWVDGFVPGISIAVKFFGVSIWWSGAKW
jgi:hypothetical protein